jgi:hypothetical protein
MEFHDFKVRFQEHVQQLIKDQQVLFWADVDPDEIWNLYLDSFPPGTNEIYRERREYDCSCCRQFIRAFGGVVVIKDNQVRSIWDFAEYDTLEIDHPSLDEPIRTVESSVPLVTDHGVYHPILSHTAADNNQFAPVVGALSSYVHLKPISDVYVTKESKIGVDKSHELRADDSVHTWGHLFIELPERFVSKSSKSIGAIQGEARDLKDVFQRSLDEITQDAVETVLELIVQKSLYKGEEWESVLQRFLDLKRQYADLSELEEDNFCWIKSTQVGGVIGKIRNHSIGTLLVDLSGGMDLNEAVRRYEKIVAPTNYKRPKAIFTTKMIEQAEVKINSLGLLGSLARRHAILDDITVNNILFANRDVARKMGSVFDDLKQEAAVNPRRFDKVEEVGIDHFVENMLPNITNINVLFENRHIPSLVSLISPQNRAAPSLFKWDNGFSWAYNGNITDSMKERVKAAGGRVDGALRFSIQWNENGDNQNDFDAHCIEPHGNEIYYAAKRSETYGSLDVDIIHPGRNVAVENITWLYKNEMLEGSYHFFVHNFTYRGGRSGFTAEIEYDGQIYSYEYGKELKHKEKVTVAKIEFSRQDGIKFIESLPSTTATRTEWGIPTNQFHPVTVAMYSPNYWDGQSGIGHRHYFFMLDGCRNPDRPNGFFNEFLREEFMEHKRVFEALGSKMRVEPSDDQLSGLGFSATKRNALIAKVEGAFTRTIKINF